MTMPKASKNRTEGEMREMREANHLLKQWLFDHIDNPYPTGDEKRTLMESSGLNRKRIDAWFKNARHRYMCSATKVVNPNYSRYPSQVTKILVDWLAESSPGSNRYPSKKEEQFLLKQTKLTRVQLRRWFANARKRGLLTRIHKKHTDSEKDDSDTNSSPDLSNIELAALMQLSTAADIKRSLAEIPAVTPQSMSFWNMASAPQGISMLQPVAQMRVNPLSHANSQPMINPNMVASYIQGAQQNIGANSINAKSFREQATAMIPPSQLFNPIPSDSMGSFDNNRNLQQLRAIHARWLFPN